MEDKRDFWMVWRFGGPEPNVKHYTEESARAEAGRLAADNQGKTFYVLKSVWRIGWSRGRLDDGSRTERNTD